MVRHGRSYSTTQAQAIRKAQIRHVRSHSASNVLNENVRKVAGPLGTQQRASVIDTVAVTDSDQETIPIGSTEKPEVEPQVNICERSWWEKVLLRRKRGTEHQV